VPAFAAKVPVWDGAHAPGRHLLLWAEQGIGDAIQFLRYVRAAAARTGRITICCHRELLELAREVEGVDAAKAFGEPLPGFEIHAPLMSLPHLLNVTDPAASWQGAYLHAPPGGAAGGAPGPGRIGLVWSGNPEFTDNTRRACPPEMLRPLVELPGPVFYALQKGAAAESAGRSALGDRVQDLSPGLSDFADTARAISRLDLVVTVDTAVAHLAGAMAKPVWVMLHHAPDWRWQGAGESTAWYPTMRLFRQKAPGDWPSVIREIRQSLARRTGSLEGEAGKVRRERCTGMNRL
jgi:hypothetical protein